MTQTISIYTDRDKTINASKFINDNRTAAYLWSNGSSNFYDIDGFIWEWWHEGTGTYPECTGDIVA